MGEAKSEEEEDRERAETNTSLRSMWDIKRNKASYSTQASSGTVNTNISKLKNVPHFLSSIIYYSTW